MDFDEALSRWGARYLKVSEDEWPHIHVEQELDGGSGPYSWDPDGYNSMWESASVKVMIRYKKKYIEAVYVDFVDIVKELWEVSK
jgi:hypothetical protein